MQKKLEMRYLARTARTYNEDRRLELAEQFIDECEQKLKN